MFEYRLCETKLDKEFVSLTSETMHYNKSRAPVEEPQKKLARYVSSWEFLC